MHHLLQPTPHDAIIDFDIACIVAGSRHYDDYEKFSKTMFEYIKQFGDKSIVFISGMAKTGADALIVRWCKEHRLPWSEFPADWDQFRKAAGYIRNIKMASYATHLIAFYDGVSKGTGHMLDISEKRKLHITPVLITIEEKENGRERSFDF